MRDAARCSTHAATETGQNSILVKSWHHDSRQVKARLKLAFLQQHSVLAPTMHSGSVGFTRTQTVMLLFNTASVRKAAHQT
jgi:hypothetical protein|eukprot:5047321-Prymnesium_polylepis.2